MPWARDISRPGLVVAVAIGLLIAVVGATSAGFSSQANNPGDNVSAATDFRAPTISASVIAKGSGGVPGFIKQGGTYRVYATVSDTGAPASGVASVTADVSTVTTGETLAALTSGSFPIGGVTYNYRSASLTANAGLSAGVKSYTVTATDNASNAGTLGSSVTVDNTAPTATDIQTANTGGGTVGKAEQGNTITFTFSEPMEPDSIVSGWSGGSTNVMVQITHGLLALGNDGLEVFNTSGSTQIPLGAVNLGRNDYVNGLLGGGLRFGASGAASTMTMSGSSITITLGNMTTFGALVSAGTAGGNGTMSWDSETMPTDRAGNASTGNVATESGGGDKEF